MPDLVSPATRSVRTACCYCGVGCGLVADVVGDRVVAVRGDPEHPSNRGALCTKGATLPATIAAGFRIARPEVRFSRDSARTATDWASALDYAASRFADILRTHGPEAVAFYLSGQLLTEDYYVFHKLARGFVGTPHVDTNSRLCMASAVMGYKTAFGVDAPPACYDDIEAADCLLVAGANPAYAHPVLFRRIEAAKRARPDLRLIVLDPRTTDTARLADLHLPLAPGADVAVFNAMLHVLIAEGRIDGDFVARHTTGFDAVRRSVAAYSPADVAPLAGLAADDIVTAARWFGSAPAALSLWCQGLNQSVQGTDKNLALLNLHLATGQVGRPGAGPLSLTGQPNAMGGREVGGMATALTAHRDPANPEDRAAVAAFWGVEKLPAAPGLTAVPMFEAMRSGRIKAVWIACTNPAQSLPAQARVREALGRAEFVVLQDAFVGTETAAFADVLLPAAPWGEKSGTQTNSERRITRVRALVPPKGEARQDWRIATGFAHALGRALGRGDEAQRLFPYTDADAIFREHRESTRGRDLDITGLDYAVLESRGPQQWPFPEGTAQGSARLYEDRRFATPDGRARFVVTEQRPLGEPVTRERTLRLNTGRLRDQWHGMSRTGIAARLYGHASGPVVDMAEADMRRRRIADGDLVRIESARGAWVAPVRESRDVRAGSVFVPMHWGSARVSGAGVNGLTLDAIDPVSGQPEFKQAAVAVERIDLPVGVIAVGVIDPEAAVPALQGLLGEFPHAHWALAGGDRPVVAFRAACAAPLAPDLLARLGRAIGLDSHPLVLDHRDQHRGVVRQVSAVDGRVTAVCVTGDVRSLGWVEDAIAERVTVADLRQRLLGPTDSESRAARREIVCTCLDVDRAAIRDAVAAGATVERLQADLRCGTQCGSCLPALRRLAGAIRQEVAA